MFYGPLRYPENVPTPRALLFIAIVIYLYGYHRIRLFISTIIHLCIIITLLLYAD